ncbi:MAG: methyltransferase domain-containing protein [Nocardioidaceae bacterium]|nr:methyltransferase domain-containing protein [Nocardioidaceae bacterium]
MCSARDAAQYDAFAADFDRHAQDSAHNAYYDRPAVLDLLGDVTGKDLLDAGCGSGLYAAELARRGARVTGFDQSAQLVALAQQRLGASATIHHADLDHELSWLPDASQDLALLALVIHHVQNRGLALCELHRVLRPDGRVIISTAHPTADWLQCGGSYFVAEQVDQVWQQDWVVRWWRQPLERWCAEFVEAGFVIEALVEPRPLPEMADRYPDVHAQLMREPGFIAFRLAKAR